MFVCEYKVNPKPFQVSAINEAIRTSQFVRNKKYGKVTVAVAPYNTSQNCSNCGQKVQKSLSTRTHICPHCRFVADRDVNAGINILQKGLSTVGHTESLKLGEFYPLVSLEQSCEIKIGR